MYGLLGSRKNSNNMCQGNSGLVASGIAGAFLRRFLLALIILCAGLLPAWQASARQSADLPVIEARDLPKEARDTLAAIRAGGPFPWPKDGSVFGNYEGLLPKQKRGYYHEFTVRTPGMSGRGARRIIVGGNWQDSRELYYTSNHYATFSRIKE